jgi:hypothetical protein
LARRYLHPRVRARLPFPDVLGAPDTDGGVPGGRDSCGDCLGAQRGDVRQIRAIWAVQGKLALDADEEKAIELKGEFIGGHERAVWNSALSLPHKGFDSVR